MKYSILDPTGNITALAESPVRIEDQPAAAAAIMRRHPEVEQVGFLRQTEENGVEAELRMAGGEFCGNASMCAAALLSADAAEGEETAVRLHVSGAARPVEVRVTREDERSFRAAVEMPPAVEITEREFAFGELRGLLPLVRMEGISHAIILPESAFFPLLHDPGLAEQALRAFCHELRAGCLGFMFLEDDAPACRLTPLVYVPGSGTMFWEKSCASGTAAAALVLAKSSGSAADLRFSEPGGVLRAECSAGGIRLHGSVVLAGRHEM